MGLEIIGGLGWPDVFQILAVMPRLKKVTFEAFGFGSTVHGCECVALGGRGSHLAVDCCGRSEAVAVLRRLANESLVYETIDRRPWI